MAMKACGLPGCDIKFEPSGGGQTEQKYCCKEHRWEYNRRKKKGELPESPMPTPDELIKKKELKSIEKKVREDVGRTKILADLLDESVARVNSKDIKPYRPTRKTTHDPEVMVVLRSDFHPGLVTPSYNLEEFHRRMELFTDRIIRIYDLISQTIPLEEIWFINLGDLVSGQGIFPNQSWKSETHVLEQVYEHASPELIRQNLTMLEYFPVVRDRYVPGNHGRTGKENPDQVNFDNVASRDVWRRFEFEDRVDVQYTWEKFLFVDIFKWRFFCTHGNLVRSWMSIPFYGLVQKGMRWQGSMPSGPFDYFLHGHFHVPFNFPWNNFEIMGNGTLVSDDDFAIEELGMSSTPAQICFGVHPKHGVTWRYVLDLS